jgi:WbqC-like protein family
MTRVVISQSMYFPWIGMLEQIRLADVYVYYDDVQFTKGGFLNRVQIKTAQGARWLTVPTRDFRLGQAIWDVPVDARRNWRHQHRETLSQAYAKAPYHDDMLRLAGGVFEGTDQTIGTVSRASLMALVDYFELRKGRQFLDARELGVGGSGSRRVRDIVALLRGTTYITGHGARNYLEHELFESSGIRVEYMNYLRTPYPQLHGEFNPHVSALDLVANCGREGAHYISSGTVYWKTFIQ